MNNADEINDDDLKWLMEHSHNAYLAWIALWLACLIGIGNILITLSSNPDLLIIFAQKILVFTIYGGLVGGMVFSVYRVSNIINAQIIWANQIANKFLKDEILSHRGKLSTFVVDNKGKLCKRNRNFVIVIHVIFGFVFLLPTLLYH